MLCLWDRVEVLDTQVIMTLNGRILLGPSATTSRRGGCAGDGILGRLGQWKMALEQGIVTLIKMYVSTEVEKWISRQLRM